MEITTDTTDVAGRREVDLEPPTGELDAIMHRLRLADHYGPRIKAMLALILEHQQALCQTTTGRLELYFGGDSVRGKIRLDLPAVPGAGR